MRHSTQRRDANGGTIERLVQERGVRWTILRGDMATVLVFVSVTLLLGAVGVGVALRGRIFQRAERRAVSPYRGGPVPVTTNATPRSVRALAIVSVLVGVGALLCGIPLGIIAGKEIDLSSFYDHPSPSDPVVHLLIVLATCESLVLAPALATVAVLVARGRALGVAPVVSVLWIVHTAVIVTAWFLRLVDRIAYATSHDHAPALGEWALRLLIGLFVLALGVAHAVALWAAARRMRVLAEANARASA